MKWSYASVLCLKGIRIRLSRIYIQWSPFIVITDNVINRVMLSHLWIPIRTNTTTCGKFCLMWSCIRFMLFFSLLLRLSFPRNFILPLPLYPSLEVTVHSSAKPVHGVVVCWRETCQLGERGGIPATLSLLHNKTHPCRKQFIYLFCFGNFIVLRIDGWCKTKLKDLSIKEKLSRIESYDKLPNST